MQELIRRLGWLSKNHHDATERQRFWRLYRLGLDAESTYEDIIFEAKMIGVRNPAFEGDMIGWLDDDFDKDEPEPPKKKSDKDDPKKPDERDKPL
jgi:hypothetical protein